MVSKNKKHMNLFHKYGANHYSKFEIVPVRAKGALFWDADGKRYIDMLSSYSAVSQGHCNPNIYKAVMKQGKKVTLVSGALYNATIGLLLQKIAKITGMQKVLLKNGGVEGVETAIKAMRAWGYKVKKIPKNKAEIIVAKNNFHGRTTTVISFSSCAVSKEAFGPFMKGFKLVDFNDVNALKKAITKNTCGVMLEPIQGEGGVVVPDKDYFKKVAAICKKKKVLLCMDEIQTGLGRTGKMFAFQHFGVKPDMVIIGKALGGGFYPIAGIATSKKIMDTAFVPGNEGSTHGENPMAGAVGIAALEELEKKKGGINLVQRTQKMGKYFRAELRKIDSPLIKEVRGYGLLIGLEFHKEIAHEVAVRLLKVGMFAKDTHGTTIRFAPPLMIEKKLLDESLKMIKKVILSF